MNVSLAMGYIGQAKRTQIDAPLIFGGERYELRAIGQGLWGIASIGHGVIDCLRKRRLVGGTVTPGNQRNVHDKLYAAACLVVPPTRIGGQVPERLRRVLMH